MQAPNAPNAPRPARLNAPREAVTLVVILVVNLEQSKSVPVLVPPKHFSPNHLACQPASASTRETFPHGQTTCNPLPGAGLFILESSNGSFENPSDVHGRYACTSALPPHFLAACYYLLLPRYLTIAHWHPIACKLENPSRLA